MLSPEPADVPLLPESENGVRADSTGTSNSLCCTANCLRKTRMDPTFLPAVKLAEMTRRREVGCLELLDHYIARIGRLDGPINSVVVKDFDRARDRARAMDQATDRSAALFGVPMTVKESFDVAGLPSTRGHLAAKNLRARASSIAVRRL